MLSGHADSSLREGTKSTFTFIMCHYWKRLEGCLEGVLTDISLFFKPWKLELFMQKVLIMMSCRKK